MCDEPEYTAMQGFVLDQHKHAIVANWVGTDGIWQVDVTDTRPVLREFADATGYAHAHSVITAPTPAGRLHALVLTATVGEDDGVTLTAAVREGRRPRPGVPDGALVVGLAV